MKQCLYDNPNTCYREVWRDGKIQVAWSADLICQFYKMNPWNERRIPWQPGRIDGDPKAMRTPHSHSAATNTDEE